MQFEFDPTKSAANHDKHGIDFENAQALWSDPRLLVIPARSESEPRWVAISRIGNKHWSAIFTLRGEAIRLISARRARTEEVALYESP